MDRIELQAQLIAIILMVCVMVLVGIARADATDICFDKAYDQSFTPPATKERFKVIRGKLKRRIKQCQSVYCLLKMFPKSRRRLLVVYKRRGKGYVTYGNMGWASSNFFLGRRDQAATALAVAAGVELENIGTDKEQGDREFHDRFAYEHRCLRRRGESVESFNEVVVLP